MDPSQLQPGYKLDRYELLTPLAYGGMASVWLARFGGRLGFERLVVVKMILPQYSQDPRFQQMFLDEARIASRIEHSNVARILDVGEHEGNYFIVMEWVDGDSLSKLIRGVEQQARRVPAGIALKICADAAAGLHAAHTLKDRDGTLLGVVHRDVSPQNLLIANTGATMLIDFGVAKARDRVSAETSAGQLKGKIRYMAPEQARGLAMDHRADVWALGAILYELFAGAPPYDGTNEVATLHKLTSGQAPPPLPPETPAAVHAIIARSLAFQPDDRYSTALEMNLALESAMVEIGESTSMAMVAHYTGHLLADRKQARKTAVDAALARANAGAGAGEMQAPLVHHTPESFAIPRGVGDRTAAMPYAPVQPPPPAPSAPGSFRTQPAPYPGQPDAMQLGESPSAASNATLGSAAVEFSQKLETASAQRRRFVGIALSLSAVAAVVGVALIVSTLRKHEPTDSSTSASPSPAMSLMAGPSASASAEPVPTATATTEPSAEAVAPSASASATPEPTAASTHEPAGGPDEPSNGSSGVAPITAATTTVVSTHTRPLATPPTTTVKPTTTAKPAPTGKKDYGF
jgi:predicted Ser/Thr protein kinase